MAASAIVSLGWWIAVEDVNGNVDMPKPTAIDLADDHEAQIAIRHPDGGLVCWPFSQNRITKIGARSPAAPRQR